jgi:hypothetical protein
LEELNKNNHVGKLTGIPSELKDWQDPAKIWALLQLQENEYASFPVRFADLFVITNDKLSYGVGEFTERSGRVAVEAFMDATRQVFAEKFLFAFVHARPPVHHNCSNPAFTEAANKWRSELVPGENANQMFGVGLGNGPSDKQLEQTSFLRRFWDVMPQSDQNFLGLPAHSEDPGALHSELRDLIWKRLKYANIIRNCIRQEGMK